MKKNILISLLGLDSITSLAQSEKTELYDLIKKLLYDSTGYENVGDWTVGKPKKFPVKWKSDRIEMSEDTSINFYRIGSAEITIKGRNFTQAGQVLKWNIMLKGPRMGYGSYSIVSLPLCSDMQPKYTLDSIFG
jgi:hypothetical protein